MLRDLIACSLVNDCSTDHTLDIIEQFSNVPQVKILCNETNLGEAGSINRAIVLADGEYIVRMDGDDISIPDRLEKQVNYMDSNPQLFASGGNSEIFRGDTIVETTNVGSLDKTIKANFFFASGNLLNPTTIIRHQQLQDYQLLWNPSQRIGCDLEFWIEAMLRGAIFGNLPDILLRYRVHNNNLSHNRESTENKRSQLELRSRIISLFYPQLSRQECLALGNFLLGGKLEEVIPGVNVAIKCQSDMTSYYGENKKEINKKLQEKVHSLYDFLSSPKS